MLFLCIRCSKFSFSELFSLWGWLQTIAFSRSVDYAHVLITCSSHCLVVVCFFPIGCFDNRKRSERTPEESLYLHISEGPAVIYIYLLEGAEGGRGKGGDKNLPDPPYVSGVFLWSPFMATIDSPFLSSENHVPFSPPPPKKKKKKKNFTPPSPPRARC